MLHRKHFDVFLSSNSRVGKIIFVSKSPYFLLMNKNMFVSLRIYKRFFTCELSDIFRYLYKLLSKSTNTITDDQQKIKKIKYC